MHFPMTGKNYILGLFILVLLGISAYLIYQKLNPKELPLNLVAGTGRIDGDLIPLNVKYAGRIKTINIEDGQAIKKDEVVAVLKSDELDAELKAINEQIAGMGHQLNAKQVEHEIAKTTIPLAVDRAEESLNNANSKKAQMIKNIDSQKFVVEQDKRDYIRKKNLLPEGAIAEHSFELAELQLNTDTKKLQALKDDLSSAESFIEVAKIELKNAKANLKKLDIFEQNIYALIKHIAATKALREKLIATISELTLKSPVEGYINEKVAEPGQVIGAGGVAATLIDPKSFYLKMFVDTIYNAKIKIGDRAVIFLDALPDDPIPAKVIRIAAKAEFTPKEVSVRSDRIQRMYAVHLKPLKVNKRLHLGLPAIGVITLDDKGLPKSLNDIPEI